MILDKKQIQVIFLYQFKMGCKTAQTTWNINEASGPWTANEHTVQWRFKKFCKGDNSLEDECSGQPLEVDNTNWEAHQSLTTTWEVAEETDDHSMVGHLKQSGKVKKLNKGCFHELTTNQKKLFWSVFFSYSMQQWQSISRSDWEVQWKVYFIWQLEMISSVAGSRRNSKALPKAKPAPKKVMVTDWWSAAGLIHYSFLNPGKTITSEKYAQPMMRCTENCNTCSQCWSTERAQFPMTMPGHTPHNQGFKSGINLATKFCLIHHIHLTSCQPPFQASWQLFAGKTLP